MHDLTLLRDLVILVAVAIPVVVVTQRLRVPTVVGFLLTGLAIGPYALGLIGETREVRGLAELGVLLLLFTIGLELSLSRIMRMRRLVLQGGGIQVVVTMIVVMVALRVVAGVPLAPGLFYGSLVALSSTAIVLRSYTERGEVDTPHGRVTLGILLFQDLSIVPLMLLAPILAGAGSGPGQALRDMGISLAVVGTLVVGGRYAAPWVLERIVALRNREIFTLTIVLFGLGSAWLTAEFGLSLALGAFLAGLVISESPYGIQAMSDVLPFRDTFSGIFFISIGMLLDLQFVGAHLAAVLGLTAGILMLKALIAAGATRSLRWPTGVSVQTGLGLAQVGEFSFVLALVGLPLGLLSAEAYQYFLATSVLTMLAAPFVIAASPWVANLTCRLVRESPIEILPHEERGIAELDDHVIIVGYGLNGRNLARVLGAAKIPHVILEQNGHVVRSAHREKNPIYFGDGTRREVLERVGIERARIVVFAIASVSDERRGVTMARHLNPAVSIVVRTRYVSATEDLLRAGADVVVPEEFETSIEIFSRVLRMYGIPGNLIEREVAAVRGEAYEVFRGLAVPDLRLDALQRLGVRTEIDTIEVEEHARAVDGNPVTLGLRHATGATVIAVVRDGVAHHLPDPEFNFRRGDTVVLVGDRDALVRARAVFRDPQGEPGPA
jgi:CPA2 family monovalent cation:H+ antiporter-2